MRIPQKYSQTSIVLYTCLCCCWFSLQGTIAKESPCLLPARPETQLQKITKLRERLFFAVTLISLF